MIRKLIMSTFLIAGLAVPTVVFAAVPPTTPTATVQSGKVSVSTQPKTIVAPVRQAITIQGTVVKGPIYETFVRTNKYPGPIYPYMLQTVQGTYGLNGNIVGLDKYIGQKIEVSGFTMQPGCYVPLNYMKSIQVTSYKPVAQVKTYTGRIVVNYIEGKHYDLLTPTGRYTLVGNIANAPQYINYLVNVTGIEQGNVMTTYQSGKALNVKSIVRNYGYVPAPRPVPMPVITK